MLSRAEAKQAIAIGALVGALAACTQVHTVGGTAARHSWTIPGEFRWADGEDLDNLNPLLSTQTGVEDLSSFTICLL